MAQLASMQADYNQSNKKRRPMDDQSMDEAEEGNLHRGGMQAANSEHFKSLARRLSSSVGGP